MVMWCDTVMFCDYQEEERDAYCWICHQDGSVVGCEVCSRAYHLKCLNMDEVVSAWVCPECEVSVTPLNSNIFKKC